MAIRGRGRSKPNSPRSLVGSAIRLPSVGAGARKAYRKPEEWQTECLDFFDTNPELKFAGWWVGNLLAKVRLFVAVEDAEHNAIPLDAVDDDGNLLVPDIPEAFRASALAELARLRSDLGGQADIQRELGINLDFAGECSLIGWAPRDAVPPKPGEPPESATPATTEQWEIRSIDEVTSKDGKWLIKDEPKSEGRALTEADTIIRCYQKHPRWSKLADSNVRGVISEARLLQALTGQMYAETLSRHNAGAITLPNGLTFGKAQPNGPSPQDGDEQKEVPFVDDMTDAIMRPIDDPSDPLSVAPWIIQGEKELLHPDYLRKIDFGRGGTGDELDKKITQRITRLAHGVNLPVEVLLGHMQTTFANAAQIDEDTFTDFLEPRVLLQCDVLTVGFLRANLAETYPNEPELVRRVFVWYDASALMDEADPSESADEAVDNFAINLTGYRKAKGIPEEWAPSVEEQMGLVAMKRGILTAELTAALLKIAFPGLELPEPAALAPGAAPADDADAGDEGEAEVTAVARMLRATGLPVSVLAALAFQLTSQAPPVPLPLTAGGSDPPPSAPA